MRFCLPLAIGLLLLCSFAYSQTPALPKFSHAAFVQLGGISPVYSFNYERLIRRNIMFTYKYRIGISLLPHVVAIPVGINVFDTFGNHHFQMSAGITPYIEDYDTFTIKGSESLLYMGAGVGYRYQRPEANWFVMMGLNPMVKLDPSLREFIGPDPQFILSGNLAAGFRW
ncbi:MAG: hypothetical protein R3C61_14435 [Bacteroidia bacterium]